MEKQTEQASEATESTVGGYVRTLQSRFRDNPEWTSPASFAAAYKQALIGFGQPLPMAEEVAQVERLSNLRELGELTAAAGQQLALHQAVLEGLFLRFSGRLQRLDPATCSAKQASEWFDLTLKASRGARQCMAASVILAQDLRVLGVGQQLDEVDEV